MYPIYGQKKFRYRKPTLRQRNVDLQQKLTEHTERAVEAEQMLRMVLANHKLTRLVRKRLTEVLRKIHVKSMTEQMSERMLAVFEPAIRKELSRPSLMRWRVK